jgi:hypothetical protein
MQVAELAVLPMVTVALQELAAVVFSVSRELQQQMKSAETAEQDKIVAASVLQVFQAAAVAAVDLLAAAAAAAVLRELLLVQVMIKVQAAAAQAEVITQAA